MEITYNDSDENEDMYGYCERCRIGLKEKRSLLKTCKEWKKIEEEQKRKTHPNDPRKWTSIEVHRLMGNSFGARETDLTGFCPKCHDLIRFNRLTWTDTVLFILFVIALFAAFVGFFYGFFEVLKRMGAP